MLGDGEFAFITAQKYLDLQPQKHPRWINHLGCFILFMRPAGLEPAQVYTHCPLKTARLPFRHDRRTISVYQMFVGISI